MACLHLISAAIRTYVKYYLVCNIVDLFVLRNGTDSWCFRSTLSNYSISTRTQTTGATEMTFNDVMSNDPGSVSTAESLDRWLVVKHEFLFNLIITIFYLC